MFANIQLTETVLNCWRTFESAVLMSLSWVSFVQLSNITACVWIFTSHFCHPVKSNMLIQIGLHLNTQMLKHDSSFTVYAQSSLPCDECLDPWAHDFALACKPCMQAFMHKSLAITETSVVAHSCMLWDAVIISLQVISVHQCIILRLRFRLICL